VHRLIKWVVIDCCLLSLISCRQIGGLLNHPFFMRLSLFRIQICRKYGFLIDRWSKRLHVQFFLLNRISLRQRRVNFIQVIMRKLGHWRVAAIIATLNSSYILNVFKFCVDKTSGRWA
jgi:hypothetical protein